MTINLLMINIMVIDNKLEIGNMIYSEVVYATNNISILYVYIF